MNIRAVLFLVALAAGCSGPLGHAVGGSGGGAPANFAFVGLEGATRHIYLMNVDASGIGSNPTRLTADTGSEYDVFWSPDGTRLVYARDFNGAGIYVINADGSGEQRLSPTPGFDTTPYWSPDGTRIVYVHLLQPPQPNGPPPMTDIRIMNADGTDDHTILANTRFSVEPQWSVNDQIVFMSLMNGGKLDIYTMNPDGTGLQRLTNNGANNADPAWSPDGAKLSFGSDREGADNVNIYTMNADGSNVVQLTHFEFPEQASDTNWASDGKKIAFEYDLGGQKQSLPNAYAEVWTMNADGSGQASTGVQCSDAGCNPRWQPNAGLPPQASQPSAAALAGTIRNGRVACAGPDSNGVMQIFSYAPDGTDRKQLTHDGASQYPSWSPDGTQILFSSTRTGPVPQIWIMAEDGSDQHEISSTAPGGITPFMSPDGQQIAFSGIQPGAGHPEIWVMDATGAHSRRLTFTPAVPAGEQTGSVHPTWSPDGSHLVYASAASGQWQIWVMNADGSQQTQLTHGNGADFPDSNVPDWSPDGTQIVFWSGFEARYGDVWVMNADGSHPRQITQTPAPLSSDNPHWSADGTKILFTSNRSGSSVDEWVVEATGGDPSLFASGMTWGTWQPLR